MKITKEDFESWLASPVTEAVHAALVTFAKDAEATWLDMSWLNDNCDPMQLRDLKARATVAIDLKNWTFEDLEKHTDEQTPERNTAD
jgi:hypothetical protein